MENRIVTAVFKDSAYAKSDNVWQWDYGQILRIQGLKLPTAVEVHFAVSGASESITRIGTTKDGVTDVVIPDSLIETGKNLVAYVYLRDSESGNTEYQIDMTMSKRAKPEAYNTPGDKELFGQAIEAVNKAADRAEKAGQDAIYAAEQAEADAQKTAEDRKEVAKMVETVTDISEQVKKVEELSNKAQESVTQAETSATAAEKAKEQAETAKAGAETAAGKTAEDRTAVNQAKTAVEEAQRAVRADRTAVEEAKQSVEQLGNAIPEATKAGVQAVNQAKQTAVDEIVQTGTAHKTAVDGAGTKAVQDVENVKQTATEAVETAKTEATQAVQTEGTKQIKAVQEKGTEVLQSIPEDFPTQMEAKLNKQQGIENKGKALVIGDDGLVIPGEVQSGGGDGIAIINTMSGESPLAIPDSAERPLERLELGGNTEQVQTTYEPSPECPQEIKNVGKWNDKTKKYEVDVKITGKNLFDVDYFAKNEVYQNKEGEATNWKYATLKVEPNTTYTVSKGKNTKVNGGINNDFNFSGALIFYSNTKSVKITSKDDGVLYIMFYYRNEDVNVLKEIDIQVELGKMLTEYEPYKVQVQTLTSDRPITKWDKLVEQDGQIGWLYKSKLNEIPKTGYEIRNTDENKYGVYFGKKGIFKDAITTLGSAEKDSNLFTHFKPGNPYSSNGNIAWLYVAGGNTDLRLRVDDETINTVELFEKYIADKDIKIIYETTSTEFVPLPHSEQNAIRALKTYYPTTVITVDGGELDPDIKATYTADTKNYIDNKISAKMASIMSQYQNRTVKLLSLMPMETQAAMIENDTNNILESEVTQ